MGSIAFIKVMAAEKSFMRNFLEMLLDCPVSCQPASGARRSRAFPLERGEVPLGQGVHFSFRNSFRVINSPASYFFPRLKIGLYTLRGFSEEALLIHYVRLRTW